MIISNIFPILAFSDLHEPFSHKNALKFMKEMKKKWKPKTVICCGDLVDFHALSRHTTEPTAYDSIRELEMAKKNLKKWVKLFPEVIVTVGNHDRIPVRRAKELGIATNFLKSANELLELPEEWIFVTSIRFEDDNDKSVLFTHILPSSPAGALNVALKKRCSTVGAHTHRNGGVLYQANSQDRIFGGNCGWLGDEETYAMEYAKETVDKGILGCVVVLDSQTAYFEPMKCEDYK